MPEAFNDIPFNGITSWTDRLTPEQVARLPWNAGVQPAGGAFSLPGANPQTFNQWANDFDPKTASAVLQEPIRQAEEASGVLRGLRGNAPDEKINQIEAGFKAAIPRFPELVKAGMDIGEADALLLAPLRDAAKSLAKQYQYRAATEQVTHLRPVKLPNGGWGAFNPMTGKVDTVVEGEEKMSEMDRSILNKAGAVWAEAASGKYGDPNEPQAQNMITNAYRTIQSVKEKYHKPSPIAPAGSTVNTNSPSALNVGDVYKGYRYLGGNKADRANWRKL